MSASQPQLAVFDLCDTLYDENTTVGFIRHHARLTKNEGIERCLSRWLDRASPFFYVGAALYRLSGMDLARTRLVAALAGESRAQPMATAEDYVHNVLPDRANAQLHDRLNAHLAAGDRIVLVSSSLDLVVGAVAKELGAEYFASALGFADDVCTGRIDRDLTGNKGRIVRRLAGSGETRLTVYTDNRSDLDLVSIADEAVIVIPRQAADVRWAGDGVEYLKL